MNKTLFASLLLLCINAVNAQFGKITEISSSTAVPLSSKFFDLDNDLDLDILIISREDRKIAWYENLGGGNYGKQKIIADYIYAMRAVDASDVDFDGDLDIIISANFEIVWFENLGAGNFKNIANTTSSTSTGLHGGLQPSSLDYDVDLDGFKDELRSYQLSDSIIWFKNDGMGGFGPPILITQSLDQPLDIQMRDIDNDGDSDLVSCSSLDHKIILHENLGMGSFGPQQIVSSDLFPSRVYLEDLDSDGDVDVLAYLRGTVHQLVWYENLGALNFGPKQLVTNFPNISNLKAGDLDNDGDNDLIISGSEEIFWFENLGSGVFGFQQSLSSNSDGIVNLGDFDSDNDLDLVIASISIDEIVTIENLGLGSFGPLVRISKVIDWPQHAEAVDMDNDGYKDIVVASEEDDKISLYSNLGGGMFNEQIVITDKAIETNLFLTQDIDLDGDEDIIYQTSKIDSAILWQENLGNGIFGLPNKVGDTIYSMKSIASIDLDNDGYSDILSTSFMEVLSTAYFNKVAWYKNLGNGAFGTEIIISTITDGPALVLTGDIDLDGDNDVIVSSSTTDKIHFFENLGGGIIDTNSILITNNASSYKAINLMDVDIDGDDDLVFISLIDSSIVWCENQSGVFDSTHNFIASSNGYLTKVFSQGDLDNDGDMDIISTFQGSFNQHGVWYENLGFGNFNGGTPIPRLIKTVNSTSASIESLVTSDMDNDGDIDLITVSDAFDALSWMKNYYYHSNQIKGKVYFDENQNKQVDSTEYGFNNTPVLSTPQSDFSYSYQNGSYFMIFSDVSGSYQIQALVPNYWKLTTDSSVYHINVDSNFVRRDSLDFGFYPDTLINDLNTELIGSFPRCNNIINYWIDIKNNGTIVSGGVIHLQLDDSITYMNASITPDSINGQHVYWSYDSLFYFANIQINLQVSMPNFNSIGDTLISYLSVGAFDTLGNNTLVYSNSDSLSQVLVCAYDPNDKIASPRGIDSLGYIPNTTSDIEYTIRFQNTGNDTAKAVIIRDQLDSNLLWQTLTPLASSDTMLIDVDQNGEVSFKFENIMLPDSGADFLGSQGFVRYKIDLKPSLPIGTQIFNTARIYFDANPAVITNTKIHTIDSLTFVSIAELTDDKLDVVIYPNPFKNFTTIEFKEDLKGEYDLYVYDIVGKEMHSQLKLKGNKFVLGQAVIGKGIYIISIVNNKTGAKFTRKIISQ